MTGRRRLAPLGALTGLSMLLGLLTGWLWVRLVQLPAYLVGHDHFATMSEAGHTQVYATDGWFAVLGLAAGFLLGWLAWSWLGEVGWPVSLLAVAAAALCGLTCWGVGHLLGPTGFATRMALAEPGELVPISFDLHSGAGLLLWGLAACVAVFLGSLWRAIVPDGTLARLRPPHAPVAAASPTTPEEVEA